MAALNIKVDLANLMEGLFREKLATSEELNCLPGMTPEILERFKQTFELDDSHPASEEAQG